MQLVHMKPSSGAHRQVSVVGHRQLIASTVLIRLDAPVDWALASFSSSGCAQQATRGRHVDCEGATLLPRPQSAA